MIFKIEILPSDIEILNNELEETKATGVTPLFMKFANSTELVSLDRQYAQSLVQIFQLNKRKEISTYLEVELEQPVPVS